MTDEAKRETLMLLGAGAAGVMMAGSTQAQTATSTRPEVRGSMSAGRERLARSDLRGAIARFREAVRLAPEDAQAHYQLALALRRTGAAREARAEYETARRLAPYLRW